MRNLILSISIFSIIGLHSNAQLSDSIQPLMGAWLGIEGGIMYAPANGHQKFITAVREDGTIDLLEINNEGNYSFITPSFGLDFGFRPWMISRHTYFGMQLGARYDVIGAHRYIDLVHTEDTSDWLLPGASRIWTMENQVDAHLFGLIGKARFIHAPRTWFRWGANLGLMGSYGLVKSASAQAQLEELGISYQTRVFGSSMSMRMMLGGELSFVAGPAIMGLSIDASILNFTDMVQGGNLDATINPLAANPQFLRCRTAKVHLRFMLNSPENIRNSMDRSRQNILTRREKTQQTITTRHEEQTRVYQAKNAAKEEKKAIKEANKEAKKAQSEPSGEEKSE